MLTTLLRMKFDQNIWGKLMQNWNIGQRIPLLCIFSNPIFKIMSLLSNIFFCTRLFHTLVFPNWKKNLAYVTRDWWCFHNWVTHEFRWLSNSEPGFFLEGGSQQTITHTHTRLWAHANAREINKEVQMKFAFLKLLYY